MPEEVFAERPETVIDDPLLDVPGSRGAGNFIENRVAGLGRAHQVENYIEAAPDQQTHGGNHHQQALAAIHSAAVE